MTLKLRGFRPPSFLFRHESVHLGEDRFQDILEQERESVGKFFTHRHSEWSLLQTVRGLQEPQVLQGTISISGYREMLFT